LYRTLADKAGALIALVQLARISSFQGDQTSTESFLAEAASLIETLPDSVVKADAYIDMVISMTGTSINQLPPEAAHYLDESERIHRALNNPTGVAFVLLHQANRALWEGDYTLAASRFDEAERLIMELGDDHLHTRLAMSRLQLDIREGDFATARRRLENDFQQAVNRGDHHMPSGLLILASILHKQGLEVWSARVLGMAEALMGTGQMSAEAAAFAQFLRIGDIRAELRAQLGDEAFADEFVAGQQLRLDDLRTIPHPQMPAPVAKASSASATFLTAREIDVLRLLAQDLSNPQIAERLVVSRRTVDAHLRSIYDKLGVKSRDAAIRVAREQRLLSNL
jgi:ATP/maltotriose-dependent transcriptional regulator MalT